MILGEVTKVYKVKNTKTGKYSNGGKTPKFHPKGKSWTKLAPLRNHIRYYREYYEDCIIEVNYCQVVSKEEIGLEADKV